MIGREGSCLTWATARCIVEPRLGPELLGYSEEAGQRRSISALVKRENKNLELIEVKNSSSCRIVQLAGRNSHTSLGISSRGTGTPCIAKTSAQGRSVTTPSFDLILPTLVDWAPRGLSECSERNTRTRSHWGFFLHRSGPAGIHRPPRNSKGFGLEANRS
jgi:hypothetical protein